jgi:CO/xanthine dehydrogenase Mo-binding subunit
MVKDGIDAVSVEGAANLPYAIPNLQVELHTPTDIKVPVLWWRSVGSTHTAYSTETFLDRLAAEAGQDPVAMRLKLLASTRAMRRCSSWRPTRPAGARRWRRASPASGAAAAWRCMNPSTPSWPRWPR